MTIDNEGTTMKQTRYLLLAVAAAAIGLLGVALYLQLARGMLPCPWCIIQRYIFAVIALICLVTAFLPPGARRAGAGLGLLASLGGIGAGSWLLWSQANPSMSCGIDPVETALNKIFLAKWLPTLFRADGYCDAPYPPILGLSVQQWPVLWFGIFALVLAGLTFRPQR